MVLCLGGVVFGRENQKCVHNFAHFCPNFTKFQLMAFFLTKVSKKHDIKLPRNDEIICVLFLSRAAHAPPVGVSPDGGFAFGQQNYKTPMGGLYLGGLQGVGVEAGEVGLYAEGSPGGAFQLGGGTDAPPPQGPAPLSRDGTAINRDTELSGLALQRDVTGGQGRLSISRGGPVFWGRGWVVGPACGCRVGWGGRVGVGRVWRDCASPWRRAGLGWGSGGSSSCLEMESR